MSSEEAAKSKRFERFKVFMANKKWGAAMAAPL